MPQQATSVSFDLEQVKRIVWRRLPWLAIPAAVMLPFALACIAVFPFEYESSSELLIKEPAIRDPYEPRYVPRTNPHQRRISMEEKMLSSENLLGVVQELGLDREILHDTPAETLMIRLKKRLGLVETSVINEARLIETLINRLRRRVSLRLLGEQMIRVSYRGTNSALNARIVKKLVEGFVEESLRSIGSDVQANVEFYEKMVDQYRPSVCHQ